LARKGRSEQGRYPLYICFSTRKRVERRRGSRRQVGSQEEGGGEHLIRQRGEVGRGSPVQLPSWKVISRKEGTFFV
jgi:hypothetical protein